MKKIKNLLIVLLLIFGFVSCKPSNKVNPSVPTTSISQTSSEMAYKVSLSHLKCSLPNEIKRKQEYRANSLDYQYLVVDINNDEIILSIYLNNEKDYHIFDFELECNDENAKVFIDNEFKLINSLKVTLNESLLTLYMLYVPLLFKSAVYTFSPFSLSL